MVLPGLLRLPPVLLLSLFMALRPWCLLFTLGSAWLLLLIVCCLVTLLPLVP